MITTGLSPNVQRDDVRLAGKLLLQPWRWQHGTAEVQLRTALQQQFQTEHVWLFQSGRSGLLTLLRSLNLAEGSEVLLQAFTCNAVANPILWAGLTPRYVDIEADTLNMSVAHLEQRITARSKVIIIQHTFGTPANIEALVAVARKHGLIIIEDCAHALGAVHDGKLLGTFGDAALFSFGRDKVISSVFGGAITIHNASLVPDMIKQYQGLPYPNLKFVVQQLLHPVLTHSAKLAWNISATLGKVLFSVFQRLGLLSLAVSGSERLAQQPSIFPTRLPNALATLALHQWSKLAEFNSHRQHIAKLYQTQLTATTPWVEESIYLRYTIHAPNRSAVLSAAKQQEIYLGDWYTSVIAPNHSSDLERFGYRAGECPTAERAAETIINLPTHIGITPEQAKFICQLINHD